MGASNNSPLLEMLLKGDKMSWYNTCWGKPFRICIIPFGIVMATAWAIYIIIRGAYWLMKSFFIEEWI